MLRRSTLVVFLLLVPALFVAANVLQSQPVQMVEDAAIACEQPAVNPFAVPFWMTTEDSTMLSNDSCVSTRCLYEMNCYEACAQSGPLCPCVESCAVFCL